MFNFIEYHGFSQSVRLWFTGDECDYLEMPFNVDSVMFLQCGEIYLKKVIGM